MSLQAPICFQAKRLVVENSTNCCRRRDETSGVCCKQDKEDIDNDDDDDKEEDVILYQPEALFSSLSLSRGLAPVSLANTSCGRGTRTTATIPLDVHAPEFRLPVLSALPVSTANIYNPKPSSLAKDKTKQGDDSASAVFHEEILPFLAHPISPNPSSSSPVFACYEQRLWHWSVATDEQFSIAERLIKLVFFDKETSKAEYLERLAHTKKLYKKMRSVRRFQSKTDSLFFSEDE